MVILAVHLPGERDAAGHAQPLAERSGGHLHSGDLPADGVALELAPELAKGLELLPGEVAGFREGGIQYGGHMALRKDEAVPVLPCGVGRVVPHGSAEVEDGHEVGRRQRSAGMARTGRRRHLDDVEPEMVRDPLQLNGVGHGHGQSLSILGASR